MQHAPDTDAPIARQVPVAVLATSIGGLVLIVGLIAHSPLFWGLAVILLVAVIAAAVSLQRRHAPGRTSTVSTGPLLILILLPIVAGWFSGTETAVVIAPAAAIIAAGLVWWSLRRGQAADAAEAPGNEPGRPDDEAAGHP